MIYRIHMDKNTEVVLTSVSINGRDYLGIDPHNPAYPRLDITGINNPFNPCIQEWIDSHYPKPVNGHYYFLPGQ